MQTMALGVARIPVNLTISADQTVLYNAFTAAGSPTAPSDVTLTINAGVVLKAGMTTGVWPATSTFRIIKHESTAGAEDGAIVAGIGGGRNGITGDGGSAVSTTFTNGQNGQPGGDAIDIQLDVTIDNTGGRVLGGGGQGGGGGASADRNPPGSSFSLGGGGAGAGRGYNNAPPGQGGSANTVSGSNGTAGSSSGAGLGGSGGGGPDGNGGNGGDWGQPGASGANGLSGAVNTSGGTGGAAGYAVRKNGHSVTWIGGFDATHVKGSVA